MAYKRKKIVKFGFIRNSNLHSSKDIIKKVKCQPVEWKKIFSNHI